MSISKRQIIITLLLLGVILSIYLIWLSSHQQQTNSQLASNQPDWKAEIVIATQFSQTGAKKNQLTSPHVTHYPKTNQAELTTPKVQLYNPPANPWKITSKKAIAHDNSENKALTQIQLIGNVVLYQAAGPHNDEETITTTKLTIYPNQQKAKTKQPIKIVQRANDGSITIINAVGATVNQKTGVIHLLSKVRGHYEKKPAKKSTT